MRKPIVSETKGRKSPWKLRWWEPDGRERSEFFTTKSKAEAAGEAKANEAAAIRADGITLEERELLYRLRHAARKGNVDLTNVADLAVSAVEAHQTRPEMLGGGLVWREPVGSIDQRNVVLAEAASAQHPMQKKLPAA